MRYEPVKANESRQTASGEKSNGWRLFTRDATAPARAERSTSAGRGREGRVTGSFANIFGRLVPVALLDGRAAGGEFEEVAEGMLQLMPVTLDCAGMQDRQRDEVFPDS